MQKSDPPDAFCPVRHGALSALRPLRLMPCALILEILVLKPPKLGALGEVARDNIEIPSVISLYMCTGLLSWFFVMI